MAKRRQMLKSQRFINISALARNCWQVLRARVFAVHQAVVFNLLLAYQEKKNCFSCSINSTKCLDEKLALFHCDIYGVTAYVILQPLVIFICMYICYSIQRG